jgi:hypothetical protein
VIAIAKVISKAYLVMICLALSLAASSATTASAACSHLGAKVFSSR